MTGLLWKARARLFGPGIARDVCGRAHPRRALLLYLVSPFRDPQLEVSHQNVVQMRAIAAALDARGYTVDVANHDEHRARLLEDDYDLVVDLHPRETPLYRGRLRPGAVRIGYITGADPDATAAAEEARLDALARRRGVRLAPRRATPPFAPAVLEALDGVLLFAGPWAMSTYGHVRLPSPHRLVNHGWDDLEPTDPARRSPRRFLFLGSGGQVHRGLDLLLECFAAEPDLELVVCSPFRAERDFTDAYRRELFETPNVRAVGFLPVRGGAFRELQAECGAMILPSCSEGQSGAVTAAMSFGLPVIASRECGVEEPEVTLLPACTPDAVRETVRAAADRTAETLAVAARATRARLMAGYRRAHYAQALDAGLDAILGRGAAAGADA